MLKRNFGNGISKKQLLIINLPLIKPKLNVQFFFAFIERNILNDIIITYS